MIGLLPTLIAFMITLVIAILSIAWAPFAAFICARIAWQKGLSVSRYAIYGVIYSAILFLPWLHLMRQMRGKQITHGNVKDIYTSIFIFAGLVSASHIAFIFSWWYSQGPLLDTLDFMITSTIGALTFITGLISGSRKIKQLKEEQEPHNAICLPNISYIMPFMWAWATMLISSAPWFYGFFIDDNM